MLGGVRYSFVSYDRGILVAETISNGLMVTRARVKWLIGVYDKTLITDRKIARFIFSSTADLGNDDWAELTIIFLFIYVKFG